MIDFHLYFIWISKNTVNTEFLQYHFIKFGFTPPNAKQPLQGKKLQKKEAKKKKKHHTGNIFKKSLQLKDVC